MELLPHASSTLFTYTTLFRSIEELCNSNHRINKLCHDRAFWINKFKHDNLPIMEVENPNWIVMYKIMKFIYGFQTDKFNFFRYSFETKESFEKIKTIISKMTK